MSRVIIKRKKREIPAELESVWTQNSAYVWQGEVLGYRWRLYAGWLRVGCECGPLKSWSVAAIRAAVKYHHNGSGTAHVASEIRRLSALVQVLKKEVRFRE